MINVKKNTIVCGDNLTWLNEVPDNSVDLCYIDPPFFSNRNYEIIWGNGYEVRSFGDRFAGGVSHYIEWMRPRIQLIHSKLKPTGSIFLHCDWHASHRLRCLLDDVFGESNFQNEIIWQRVKTVKNNVHQGKKGFDPNTDTIFFYSKSKDSKFFPIMLGYRDEYIEQTFRHVCEKTGRRYRLNTLLGPGGAAKGNPYYEVMGVKKHWRYTKEKMDALIKAGDVVQTKPGSTPQRKQYLDQGKGVPIQNLWTDITFKPNEQLNYPTQKPELLIERIINICTEKGDVILDCFGGGGTTAKVASDLGRNFIVGDVSPVATRIMCERLAFDCPETRFELKNLPRTIDGFKEIDGHYFAEMVCDLMGWKVNERKSGDGGIDGWDGDGNPVQIKNQAKASGRADMQKLFGAIPKTKRKIARFVAWNFTKEAFEYIAEIKRENGIEITLIKCEEIFGALLIDEAKQLELQILYKERRPKNWATSLEISDVLKKAEKIKKNLPKNKEAKEA